MKQNNYSELLRNPLWQKKRLEIMNRDNFTCQFCGRQDITLQVHHRRYIRGLKPWEYSNEDYVTLCEGCHRNETEINSELYEQFMQLKEAFQVRGFSMTLFYDIMSYIDRAVRTPSETEENDPAVSLLEYCLCGTQIMADSFAAKKLGYNGREIIKRFYPKFLDEYDKLSEE